MNKDLKVKEGYVNLPYEILFAEGLSTQAKLIYCYVRKFTEKGDKCFASQAFLCKLTANQTGPMTEQTVAGYIRELEKQKLLTRSMKNNQRFLYAYAWSDRKYPFNQNTEAVKVDFPSIESQPSNHRKPAFTTIESRVSRYNTDQNTKNNTVDIPKEPLLVDNEVKVKNKLVMNKDKRKKWEGRYLYTRFSMSQQPGWRDLIDNLSDEELTQFEEYSDSLHPNEYGYKLTDVINNRLFVRQKQT